jgi:hypothetical protein
MPSDHASAEVTDERPSAVEARGISSSPPPTATLADSEPPWFLSSHINPTEWVAFERYANYLLAQIVAGLLENEGVPAIVACWTAFPGFASALIWIPKPLIHRARWIIALPPPTDAELLFLATGELCSNEVKK